jgi:hypothetical protein
MRRIATFKNLLGSLISRLLSWFLQRHEAYRLREIEELAFRREGLDLDLHHYE